MFTDLLIIGGGVVGLAAARTFASRHPGSRVVVIDKEPELGRHASGRNSGVLHAGFYYSADSLKAQLCRRGNAAWKALCAERGVAVAPVGKLVVARSAADHAGLDELLRRARANGVRLEEVDEAGAREIEPRARTVGRALWSPDTATVRPAEVMASLAGACADLGVEIRTATSFLGREGTRVATSSGSIEAGLVLNCAGLYADRVAAAWGAGDRWQLVPFKGLYLLSSPGAPPLRCNVYPVPDLGMPFLGVHLTVTPDGTTKIGPTALPARWREDYGGLGGMRADEVIEQVRCQSRLLLTDPAFRRLGARELPKASRRLLVRLARPLVRGLEAGHFRRWGRAGVRAQLAERATGRLELDFVIEPAERSLHVLNAVSPAFTCALPFAELLCDHLEAAS